MLADDKKPFLEWLTLLAESFNRKVSSLLLETYWQCLKVYPFAQVKQAILNTLQNPDRQKWGMPTPADLIVLIQGLLKNFLTHRQKYEAARFVCAQSRQNQ